MIRAVLCLCLMAGPAFAAGPQVVVDCPAGKSDRSVDIAKRISSRWNLDQPGGAKVRVVVRVEFDDQAYASDVILLESDGATTEATEAAFDAARRAVLRASRNADGGLGLTPEQARAGLILTFDPNLVAVP